MSKKPEIPHNQIVDFILSGHTTLEVMDLFHLKSINIANLRVHSAFKAMGIKRPRYSKLRKCAYCKGQFVARGRNQRTCGSPACQIALILDWHKQHPDSRMRALVKYRKTEKGKQNNIRMHRRRRERGIVGTTIERWNFAASEIKKSLRKLSYLAFRHPWEYRLQEIQKMAGLERTFRPRNIRDLRSDTQASMWQDGLRAVQTTISQIRSTSLYSIWEKKINRINSSIRMGHMVREWKKREQK